MSINGVSALDQQWAASGPVSGEREIGQAHGTAFLSLAAGDVINLTNVSGGGVIISVTQNGNGPMSASIVIERIAYQSK